MLVYISGVRSISLFTNENINKPESEHIESANCVLSKLALKWLEWLSTLISSFLVSDALYLIIAFSFPESSDAQLKESSKDDGPSSSNRSQVTDASNYYGMGPAHSTPLLQPPLALLNGRGFAL